MDSVVASALEEICAEGPSGIALEKLWAMLRSSAASSGLELCDGVKRALWTRVLGLQGLRFEAGEQALSPADSSIRSVEDSERLGVKIVAEEHIRDSFLGLHEQIAGGREIPHLQRRILERVAFARANGVTQNQLAQEFKMKGNEVFYYLRGLEYNRLIVRQSAVVKTGGKNDKAMSVLRTNFIYLYRYGRHLNSNSLQRIEITKENTSGEFEDLDGNALSGEPTVMKDVCVKDFLPALEAVCKKLEEANGKVLIVKDIKKALGYQKTKGHRAWRNIVNRLKEANLVEELVVKVGTNAKKMKKNAENSSLCLRLLKKFDPKDFQPKAVYRGYNDLGTELHDKKGQINEQLVELPIENQIYDMIDAEGSKGITMSEVCSRLGLNYKKYYCQITDMCLRFGMPIQAEYFNRTKIYRVWTNRNFRHGLELPDSAKHQISCDPLASTIPQADSNSEGVNFEKIESGHVELGLPSNDTSHFEDNRQKSIETADKAQELTESCDALLLPNKLPKSRNSRKYPCLDPTMITDQRKQRILSRLKAEKFILSAELHKWLQTLEAGKQTKMDKRTVLRILETLQKDGHCKCVQVYFPSLSSQCTERTKMVILHPSVTSVSNIVGQIYRRARDFDAECRAQSSSFSKNNNMRVDSLEDVEGLPSETFRRSEKMEVMRSNGYIPAKMVRAKILHIFLWSYLSNASDWEDAVATGRCGHDLKNPCSTLRLFALDTAIKAMPIVLFLQVAGSAGKMYNQVDYHQRGIRILSDLAIEEYKYLMDTNATSRLSSIIDLLTRLKLLQLVTTETVPSAIVVPHAQLSYAMELKPYIEVPRDRSSSHFISFDHRPRIRHDFVLSSNESVGAYWQTLEYCYAAADSTLASHAFPGSVVPEVFASRQWSSVRVMSAEVRTELYKRVEKYDPSKKISFKDCVNTANDLNLTLGQVLHASYNKGQHFQKLREDFEQCRSEITDKKRKRFSEHNSQTYTDSREPDISRIPGDLDIDDEDMQKLTDGLSAENSMSCNHDNLELEMDTNAKEGCTFISQYAFSMLKPKRRRKFLWNDEFDKQLIIQYARYRVIRGSNFFRVDWASIQDLPAHPTTCKKRMASLNKVESIRKAILMLCNILGNRYNMYLGRNSESEVQKPSDFSQFLDQEVRDENTKISIVSHHAISDIEVQKEKWDNFNDAEIKISVDEVLNCKRRYMSEVSKKNSSQHKQKITSDSLPDVVNLDVQASVHNIRHGEKKQNGSSMVSADSQDGPCSNHFTGRTVDTLNGMDMLITRIMKESLSISSVVELLKLIFLTSSSASELQTLLAETLRRYSESDIYAAFNYLRVKNFMVSGHGRQPFVLSQKFLYGVSSSSFPINTGKRAAKFSTWLCKQVQSVGIDDEFTVDFQCGEILQLCALISSGEVTMSISLPEEGIGEIDELNDSKQDTESSYEKNKKQEYLSKRDTDFCVRREKGFPGIKVILDHMTFPGLESMHNCMEGNCFSLPVDQREVDHEKCLTNDVDCCTPTVDAHLPHMFESYCNFPYKLSSEFLESDSLWKDIGNHIEMLSSKLDSGKNKSLSFFNIIKSLYVTIKQAGEQGLAMDEVSKTMAMQDDQLVGIIVDTLEVFHLVLKVNAFDCIRIVDYHYKSKYFLTLFADNTKALYQSSHTPKHDFCKRPRHNQAVDRDPQNGVDMCLSDGHKVTILNLPQEPKQTMTTNGQDCGQLIDFLPSEGDIHICRPILPWINGDGSTDTIMYKGLVRRVLGTVMQNPGILEDDLITAMDVLNPQSCRQLLELMVLDKHIFVRKMFQTSSCLPPRMLQGLIKSNVRKPEPLFRKHLFANPMSTQFL